MTKLWFVALLGLACVSCRGLPLVEDSSAFALSAGQSTLVLGSGCQKPISLGFESCQIAEGQPIPNLQIYFINPADYAVSDCGLGLFKTGAVDKPGVVELDLKPLQEQLKRQRFCLIRIETIERYPDPRDKKQLREVPIAGGFYLEVLDKGYFPVPSDDVVSWCVVIKGTNKGRRKFERCK